MNKRIVVVLALLVIVIVGLGFWVNSRTWYFSPAYSQRKTVSTFFNYIIAGKDQAAYNMTSSNYQKDNTLASFEKSYVVLEGSATKISFDSHGKSGNYVSILGTTNNTDTKTKSTFDLNVLTNSSNNPIDSVIITVYRT